MEKRNQETATIRKEEQMFESTNKASAISETEAIYRSVVDCVRDNNEQILKLKMDKLRSIIDYKDCRQLLEQCEKKQMALKRAQKYKKLAKGAMWFIDAALVVLLAVVVVWSFRGGSYQQKNSSFIIGAVSVSLFLMLAVLAIWLVYRYKNRH